MGEFDDAVAKVAPLLVRRLGLEPAAAQDMATKFLSAAVRQARINVESQSLAPSTVPAMRLQLVEQLADRLGRLPTVREVSALLRVTEPVARTILRNVLAVSDRANDVAVASVFARAKKDGTVGRKGNPPNGIIWKFDSGADLELARGLLESRGVKFVTRSEKDGEYVLVVDSTFDPAAQ